jgi:hypothetical protein
MELKKQLPAMKLKIMQQLQGPKVSHIKIAVGVILTTDVKVRYFWWWWKIRSDSDSMANFTYSTQKLLQQNIGNQFRHLWLS